VQTLRLPPRVSETTAVLSPAVTVPSLPMVARPLATESEPESETPVVETVARDAELAEGLAAGLVIAAGGWLPGSWSGGSGMS
jgi:hypothetical protein